MINNWKSVGRVSGRAIAKLGAKVREASRAIADSELARTASELAAGARHEASAKAEQLKGSELGAKTRRASVQGAEYARACGDDGQRWARQQLQWKTGPTRSENWYYRAANACESASDALLRQQPGLTSRLSGALVAKLGMAGTTAGIFSIASLVGTAGTGTAIGSLSGAAFTSATLAWIGGSMAMGSVILGVAAVSGGIGAAMGAGWAAKRYLWGKRRELTDLQAQEQRLVSACIALAAGFREQATAARPLDPVAARALYEDAIEPLCADLRDIENKVHDWPLVARQRLKRARNRLEVLGSVAREQANHHPNALTGTVAAVFIHLLADGELPDFNENEQLVLDALRRSRNDLSSASNEELAAYVKAMEPHPLDGLQNNVKGIYHELRFVRDGYADDEDYLVELFPETNYPGADVRITNTLTGEVRDVQLKATD